MTEDWVVPANLAGVQAVRGVVEENMHPAMALDLAVDDVFVRFEGQVSAEVITAQATMMIIGFAASVLRSFPKGWAIDRLDEACMNLAGVHCPPPPEPIFGPPLD